MSMEPKLLTERFEDFSARLDWRWQRILALFSDGEKPVNGFDDAVISRGYKFMHAFQNTTNVSSRQLLRRQYPHELRAYDYFLNGDHRRLKLEAMCLCEDLTQQNIADMIEEDVEVIDIFEKFFFDVRDKKKDTVFNILITPNCLKGAFNDALADKVWKYVAMVGGFKFLICLMNPFTLDSHAQEFYLDLASKASIIDYSLACMIQPLAHRHDLTMIHEKMHRRLEIEAKQKELEGGSVPEAQALILRKCMEATCIQVMDPDQQLDSPYELSIEEMLANAEPAAMPVAG